MHFLSQLFTFPYDLNDCLWGYLQRRAFSYFYIQYYIKNVSLSLSVVKQRMQMYNSPYRSLYDCILTVSRKEGLAAFYRSYSTQLTMNIPFQAVHFIMYEYMQEHFNPQRQYRPETHILSGAAAGALSAAVTTPLDVCKTLLNTQENVALSSAHISGHLSGMVSALRTVYRLGGVPAFFKGIRARVIYQMPSTAIAWSVYEFFKYFLTQQEPHIQELRRDAHKASPTWGPLALNLFSPSKEWAWRSTEDAFGSKGKVDTLSYAVDTPAASVFVANVLIYWKSLMLQECMDAAHYRTFLVNMTETGR